ncbi:hypothetical protein HMI46_01480 [Paenibacillus alvei]|uniref:Uncharacterized protein n=1 Tax=Paenibacillus alvei TaxID=44250 RepID=A0AAP6ZXL4_PAEAL|nr:hypothetical protein [Paenibacillus alvei]
MKFWFAREGSGIRQEPRGGYIRHNVRYQAIYNDDRKSINLDIHTIMM